MICIRDFIEKYNISGKILAAFSGGYDSMCLADILSKSGYDITLIHLNHNWRGQESLNEEKNCENFAKSRNIDFYCETLPDNIAKTENAAREARYDFFKRCADKFKSKAVFTAHNFDDNAETVIYRIVKGTGIAGLEGIAEHRDIFYRPLLYTKRKEIEQYCKDNNLNPNHDSSNNDTKYKRNFIRHKILPLLKEINPNVIDAINSLSGIAKEENRLINSCLPDNIINAKEPEQKILIRNLLIENNIDYGREKIENILDFIKENKTSKSGKTMSLTSGLWLFINSDRCEVITKEKKNNEEIKITNEGEYVFDNGIFQIKKYKESDGIKYPKDNENRAFVFLENIDFTLRHRKDGDVISPLGTKGTQKLKKYLNEKKIPQHLKDKIVLLCNNNEVLWAAGLGLSDKIKVKDKPTHVISFEKRDGYGYK